MLETCRIRVATSSIRHETVFGRETTCYEVPTTYYYLPTTYSSTRKNGDDGDGGSFVGDWRLRDISRKHRIVARFCQRRSAEQSRRRIYSSVWRRNRIKPYTPIWMICNFKPKSREKRSHDDDVGVSAARQNWVKSRRRKINCYQLCMCPVCGGRRENRFRDNNITLRIRSAYRFELRKRPKTTCRPNVVVRVFRQYRLFFLSYFLSFLVRDDNTLAQSAQMRSFGIIL